MGRIATNAKSIIPITWDALSGDARVGDSALTARIQYAEALITGAVLDDTGEDALDPLVAEFITKYAVVEIIPMAIDFWMNMSVTETTTGTAEVTSYESRITALKELRTELVAKLAELEPVVEPLIPNQQTRRSRPLLSSINDELLTPEPSDLGRPYAIPAG
jgi:hypothetical protein